MKQKLANIAQWFSEVGRSYMLLLLCAAIAAATGFFLFSYTRDVLHERLREKLISISSTASLLFNEEDIRYLIENREKKLELDLYRRIVLELRRIKRGNPDIKYAYIFSKTTNASAMEFIADADMIALRPELNYTGDIVDTEDWVGSLYDASGLPALREGYAFEQATTDEDIYEETWGTVYSSYAPIREMPDGIAEAVVGIDVDVTSYMQFVNATLVPFTIAVILLLSLLGVLTLSLVQMWGSRVSILRELDRQKDELLGIVSHQLAAPITSIKWYLELLQEGDLGVLQKDQRESISTMQGIATNLSDLVSMILDVSRIQLGRIHIETSPLDLNEFFKEILATIEPKALEKKQKFEKHVAAGLSTALLDKRYTRMTVENLLTNAIKYTPEGGTVKLKVEERGGKLYCEVRDTGCGIPKAEQSKIFGKLFRASNVRNTADGNGFGLYVAKGAIEAQGGRIWFESEEGKGTAFNIELPIEPEKSFL